MASLRWLLVFVIAFVPGLQAAGQEAASQPPCLAKDETVYRPGVDKVKPPKFDKQARDENPERIKGSTQLELLINSEGRICSIHILKTTDHESAVKLAKHIAEHWKFVPATREGKPVAVTFLVNFNSSR